MKFKKLSTVIVFLSLVVLLIIPTANSVFAADPDEDIVTANHYNPATAFVNDVLDAKN